MTLIRKSMTFNHRGIGLRDIESSENPTPLKHGGKEEAEKGIAVIARESERQKSTTEAQRHGENLVGKDKATAD
jgi:hypothetical protein